MYSTRIGSASMRMGNWAALLPRYRSPASVSTEAVNTKSPAWCGVYASARPVLLAGVEIHLLRGQNVASQLERNRRSAGAAPVLPTGTLTRSSLWMRAVFGAVGLRTARSRSPPSDGGEAEAVKGTDVSSPVAEIRPPGVVHAVADQHDAGDEMAAARLEGRLVQRVRQVGVVHRRRRGGASSRGAVDVVQVHGHARAAGLRLEGVLELVHRASGRS